MLYCLEHTKDRGVVMMANQVILAGTPLFTESEPLLSVSDRELSADTKANLPGERYLTVLTKYNQMDNAKQQQYLDLCGSVDELSATILQSAGAKLESMGWCSASTFLKVASIWRTNAFQIPPGDVTAVYAISSRISHSCRPNAHILYGGVTCTCRAVSTIQAGEEVTIEYYPSSRFDSVARRRQVLWENKHFVCHCARCDAPGDDTRQFCCESGQCPGTHLAANTTYGAGTDLAEEEMDLLLLPCAVCGDEASVDYAQSCRRDECLLTDFTQCMRESREDWSQASAQQCRRMLGVLRGVPQLPRHSVSGPVLRTELEVAHRQYVLDGTLRPQLCTELRYVIGTALVRSERPPDRDQSMRLALWALRMALILYGRATQDRTALDAALAVLHWRPPCPPQSKLLTRCTYCEESPAQAALALSLCGRCRRAAYCSRGCQKAHWEAHKPHCSASSLVS